MANLTFNNIGVSALTAAVPANTIINEEYTEHFDKQAASEIVEKTGIKERRFAPGGMCSSDLCYAAAEKLFAENNISRDEIDLVIFISQTPDYRMPATSVLLQDRLGLPKSTGAFDLNLGCSAFVYGLSVAFGYAQQETIRKILILNGETRSRVYSPKDRTTAFIFGDAAAAALVEKGERFGESYFSINSDGSRSSLIKADAGGYRNPTSEETLKEKVVDEHGNIRTDEHGYMNGADVFNFAIREVPSDIKKTLEFSGVEKSDIDYFVFHQANNYMNSYLAKKMKLEKSKVPGCLEQFGNTSSVSIPLTIATQLKDQPDRNRLLLCGFGVGMSWATGILNFSECKISSLVEVEGSESKVED